MCPGDGVVFTCVTDTGQLIWDLGPTVNQFYYNINQLNVPVTRDIFKLVLQNISGSTFLSTASTMHISLNYSRQNVICKDGTDMATLEIVIS